MANNLTIDQAYSFMNDVYEQATGQAALATIDAGNFTTVAQAVLKTGYDNTINSVMQVIGRIIMAVRPYSAKFRNFLVDNQRFGYITRKINFIDTDIEADERYTLTDNQSVDMYKVRKPRVLETHYYGMNTYQTHITIFRDQLDSAFRSAEGFAEFISGVIQNVSDMLEQLTEAECRTALINYISAKVNAPQPTVGGAQAINVYAEFADAMGFTTDAQITQALQSADGYRNFVQWFYSFVNTLTDKMTNRSVLFHRNVTGKELMRHTPYDRMKAYITAELLNDFNARAISNTFNAEKLRMIDFEPVTYWQNISDPQAVQSGYTYIADDGTLTTVADTAVTEPVNVLGVIFDEDAMGLTIANQWDETTPFNPAGGYWNRYYHRTYRSWNDQTENGVVLYTASIQ